MRECILCRHLAPIATPDRLTATLCATDRLTARLCAKASADLVPHRKERRRGTARICEKNSATCPEKSQLLPYATTGLSRIAGRCLIGATPRGQPRTPVSCTVRRPFVGRPVPRQLMRNELFDLTTIVPATAYHRRSYAERYSRYRTSVK